MKRLYYLATALLVLAGASSCKKNSDVQDPEAGQGKMIPFTVTAGQSGQKTSMVDGVGLAWTDGDQITVLKQDGTCSTELILSDGAGSASGTFSGEISADVQDGAALYGLYKATYNQVSDNFTASVPATQTYNATSFQEGIFPSIGTGTYKTDGTTSISFSNPMGVLRLNLKGTATVTQVKITAATSNIAGDFTVSNSFAVTGDGGNNSKSIKITCDPAITLDATGKYFNFVTAPFKSQTVTVEVTTSDIGTVSSAIAVAVTASNATKQNIEVKEIDPKCGSTVPVAGADLVFSCNGTQQTYKTVVIGAQTWMAENLRCATYSNSASATIDASLKGTTIGNSYDAVPTPYYTASRIDGGGYLYNWAAAVGVADGTKVSSLSTPRQGICPDGWHVPTTTEWDELLTKIEITDKKGEYTAGKYLKNETGWQPKEGIENLNCYGFSALPAGGAVGSSVYDDVVTANFWTATLYTGGRGGACIKYFDCVFDGVEDSYNNFFNGQSVRCLMN